MTKKFNTKNARYTTTAHISRHHFVPADGSPVPPNIVPGSGSDSHILDLGDLPEFVLEGKMNEKDTTRLALIVLGWRVIDTLGGELVHHDPRFQVIDPDGYAVDYQPTKDEAWASAERLQLDRKRQKEQEEWRKGLEGCDDDGETT